MSIENILVCVYAFGWILATLLLVWAAWDDDSFKNERFTLVILSLAFCMVWPVLLGVLIYQSIRDSRNWKFDEYAKVD